jgi:segregation and condensation protein B
MPDTNDTNEVHPTAESLDEGAASAAENPGGEPVVGDSASEPADVPGSESPAEPGAPGGEKAPRTARAKRPSMTSAELRAALEAILFASGEPVKIEDLHEAFEDEGSETVDAELAAIEAAFRDREGGFILEKAAGGFRFATRAELDPHLRKFFARKNEGRLSMAALETLAIIAYRQPMTVPEINDIRGVNSTGVIRTLLDRKMIKIAGRKNVVGSPFLYRTTKDFLIHFGLESIQDLPRLEEFTEILGETLAEELLAAATAEGDVIALEPGEAGFEEDDERTPLQAEGEVLRLDGELSEEIDASGGLADEGSDAAGDASSATSHAPAGTLDEARDEIDGANSTEDALESDASERD